MEPKVKVSRSVRQPIEVVWGLVTATRKFHALRIPGIYGPMDIEFAEVGSTFETTSLWGSRIYKRYVVELSKPEIFSFGHRPFEWTFRWQLASRGRVTEASFTRVFPKLSIWEALFKSREVMDSYEALAEATIKRLEVACESLVNGREDGLTESPWSGLS